MGQCGRSRNKHWRSCPRCASRCCSASRASTCALGHLHDLAELDSSTIGHRGDEGVDERVCALFGKKAITIGQQLLSFIDAGGILSSPGIMPAGAREGELTWAKKIKSRIRRPSKECIRLTLSVITLYYSYMIDILRF